MLIYKILPGPLWQEAIDAGELRSNSVPGTKSDLADGFIHFSTAAQVPETAARHFSGVPDLLLVAVPAAALGDALKWEPSRGGALFPHLYGSLTVTLAASVTPMPLGANGQPVIPENLE